MRRRRQKNKASERSLQAWKVERGKRWQSHFANKPRSTRLQLIREPWLRPIVTLQFASIEISRLVRGFLVRKAFRKGSDHLQYWLSKVRNKESRRAKRDISVLYTQQSNTATFGKAYYAWVATKIQSWWKMVWTYNRGILTRFHLYTVAALQIQQTWRAHSRIKYLHFLHINPQSEAALCLQRAWRRYTSIRIYHYYRDLIAFRSIGDPREMLRCACSLSPRR